MIVIAQIFWETVVFRRLKCQHVGKDGQPCYRARWHHGACVSATRVWLA